MKISLILLASAESCGRDCVWKVDNRDECQRLCDTGSYCEAWVYRKYDRLCYPLMRHGWKVTPNTGYDSGLKNQGPWYEPDTLFAGGHYCCNNY